MKTENQIQEHKQCVNEELKKLLNKDMPNKLLLEEKSAIMIKVIIAQAEYELLEWILS